MVFKSLLFGILSLSFNTVAQNSVNIPGTHIFIEPPSGFVLSESFSGLEKDDYTGIQVIDLDGGNYDSNTRNFTKENFASKGIDVIQLKDSVIDGFKAKIAKVIDVNGTSKILQIAFGDSTFSAMIMGSIPVDDKSTEELVWKSMISVRYDKSLIIDPLAIAAFTFDDSKCEFKFAKSSANSYFFSLGGVIMDAYVDIPFITVSSFPSSPKYSPKSVSLNFAQGFKNEGYILSLEEDSFAKVSGHRAYEVIYNVASPEGEHTKMYSLVLKNDKQTITLLANINTDFDKLIDECKKLSRTIRIK